MPVDIAVAHGTLIKAGRENCGHNVTGFIVLALRDAKTQPFKKNL